MLRFELVEPPLRLISGVLGACRAVAVERTGGGGAARTGALIIVGVGAVSIVVSGCETGVSVCFSFSKESGDFCGRDDDDDNDDDDPLPLRRGGTGRDGLELDRTATSRGFVVSSSWTRGA